MILLYIIHYYDIKRKVIHSGVVKMWKTFARKNKHFRIIHGVFHIEMWFLLHYDAILCKPIRHYYECCVYFMKNYLPYFLSRLRS